MTAAPTTDLARGADADWIAAWSRDLIETDLPWRWTPPRVRSLIRRPEINACVTRQAGAPKGFALVECRTEEAHLILLAVCAESRRQGIGARLLGWQVEALLTAGIRRLSLEVRARNRGARLFYQALGFRFVRELPRYYDGREDAVLMRLEPVRRLRLPA